VDRRKSTDVSEKYVTSEVSVDFRRIMGRYIPEDKTLESSSNSTILIVSLCIYHRVFENRVLTRILEFKREGSKRRLGIITLFIYLFILSVYLFVA
jgi:hypothetical protein